jgi:formate hydrogenlyase subunit 3/multisubunit Na+/H+ antiporter MnhD subunit
MLPMKTGLFPNHTWILEAYEKMPLQSTSLITGLVNVSGLYVVARLFYTVFPATSPISYVYRTLLLATLMILGFITGLAGSLALYVEDRVGRIMGYSLMSQAGLAYMILSMEFIPVSDRVLRDGFTAFTLHILSFTLASLVLALVLEQVVKTAGSDRISDLVGVGRIKPLLGTITVIALLDLMGMYPFIGFYTHLSMLQAFLEYGQYIPLTGVLVIWIAQFIGYGRITYILAFRNRPSEVGVRASMSGMYYLLIVSLALIMLGLLYSSLYSVVGDLMNSSMTSYGYMLYRDTYARAHDMLWGG